MRQKPKEDSGNKKHKCTYLHPFETMPSVLLSTLFKNFTLLTNSSQNNLSQPVLGLFHKNLNLNASVAVCLMFQRKAEKEILHYTGGHIAKQADGAQDIWKKLQENKKKTCFQCSVCQSIFMQVVSVPLILLVKLMRTFNAIIVQVECGFGAVTAARKGTGLASFYMVTYIFLLWLIQVCIFK